MLDFYFSNQFKKDLKLLKKRGNDMNKIIDIMASLIWEEPLPDRCRAHKLHGNLTGYVECHVEGDWVVVYRLSREIIAFAFTGTHSDYL